MLTSFSPEKGVLKTHFFTESLVQQWFQAMLGQLTIFKPEEPEISRKEDTSFNSATIAAVGWALPTIGKLCFQKSPKPVFRGWR